MKDNLLHEFKLALKHLETICYIVGREDGSGEVYCQHCIYNKYYQKNKECPCIITGALREMMRYYNGE